MAGDDPVSWFVIEEGWRVLDASGEDIGAVDEIVGDSSNDIFNGLAISTHFLGRPRYVEAEQVGTITEGRVHLKLSKAQLSRLEEFEEPPTSAEILPERAGLVTRAEAAVETRTHARAERVNVWRRIWWALRRLVGR